MVASNGSIKLHQEAYIDTLSQRFLSAGTLANTVPYKIPATKELPSLVEEATAEGAAAPSVKLVKDYQSLVGALLYCAICTRPDISYAVGMLCRAMAKPTPALYAQAVRVLIYLVHSKDLGLHYSADAAPAVLGGASDSNWDVNRSTSGWHFKLGHAAVSWGSKKQESTALSSTEAEIMAASKAAQDGMFLRALLSDLGRSQDATEMLIDNKGVVDITHDPGAVHARSKHIHRRYFYIRELVQSGEFRVNFVAGDANVADIFTKPLQAARFKLLRAQLMNLPAPRD